MNADIEDKCDKAIAAINSCARADYISTDQCDSLASRIQELKKKQERSLASELSELHENNLKHYIETKQSSPEYSPDFVRLQIECVSLLNEIEAALYVQEHLGT